MVKVLVVLRNLTNYQKLDLGLLRMVLVVRLELKKHCHAVKSLMIFNFTGYRSKGIKTLESLSITTYPGFFIRYLPFKESRVVAVTCGAMGNGINIDMTVVLLILVFRKEEPS